MSDLEQLVLFDRDAVVKALIDFEMESPVDTMRSVVESRFDEDWDDEEDDFPVSGEIDLDSLREELESLYRGILDSDLLLRTKDWGFLDELVQSGAIRRSSVVSD